MKLMLKWLVLVLSCVTLGAAELRRFPPMPPMPLKASLTNVQAAIRTFVVMDVAVAIRGAGGEAENVAYHFRALARVFAAMPTNGVFSVAELDKVLPPLNVDLSGVRSFISTLYGRAYDYRLKTDLPPLDFLTAVSKTFSEAIREGITQGGKEHVLN